MMLLWEIAGADASLAEDSTVEPGHETDWPQYHYNAQHTGYNSAETMTPPLELKWYHRLQWNHAHYTAKLLQATIVGPHVYARSGRYYDYDHADTATSWCFSLETGLPVWQRQWQHGYKLSQHSYAHGRLYVQVEGEEPYGFVACMDPMTGEEHWRGEFTLWWTDYIGPTLHDEYVLLYAGGTTKPQILAGNAITGEGLWYNLGAYEDACPAAYGDYCYAVVPYWLRQYRVETGEIMWTYWLLDDSLDYPTGKASRYRGWYNSPLIDTTNSLIFVIKTESIMCFDLEAKERVWRHEGGLYRCNPALCNDTLYATHSGVLKAYDALTGDSLWTFVPPVDTFDGYTPPVIANGHVYVATLNDVYAVSIESQEAVWSYPVGGDLAVGQGHLIVTTQDGYIYAFAMVSSDTEEPGYEPVPDGFVLHQNYPNPFNPSTTIEFSLPRNQQVTLTIYNVLGRPVRELIDAQMTRGEHSVIWDGKTDDGSAVASGVYLYRLTTRAINETRKMLLVR
jgi:hypothetical protein